MKTAVKVLLCLAVGACFASFALFKPLHSTKDAEEQPEVQHIPVVLNNTLTNDMSAYEELEGMDAEFRHFLRQWQIHGASLAIMRNDSLVYAKGYGEADLDRTPVTPGTIFRLASVSKLITAIGIMTLQERGLLSLNDKVFTPEGILGDQPYTASISDRRYFDITVEQLLRHSAGLVNGSGDPMFNTRALIIRNHWDTPPDAATLSEHVLSWRLGYDPGTSSDYSNYGYLLLSMIIEKVTGENYERWIRENVLYPAGCFDMHIGKNSYDQRFPNETRYFPTRTEGKVQKYDNSGQMVERVYGGNDISALLGAGAWVASAPEIAKLVASIDGKPEVKDIINERSIQQMTVPTDSVTFAIGWVDTKASGEWTRTGTLSGTTALIKYYPDGECWVLLTNTGTYLGARFSRETSALFIKSREEFSPLLPKRNLFYKE